MLILSIQDIRISNAFNVIYVNTVYNRNLAKISQKLRIKWDFELAVPDL